MADKSINDLDKAKTLSDDDSFALYKNTDMRTERGTIGQLKEVARAAASGPAADAANSAEKAAESAKDAADVALHPPVIKDDNDHWWIWDTETNGYIDSGIDAGVSLSVAEKTITGEPGSEAKVENLGTPTDPILQFTLPQGIQGKIGPEGPRGVQGEQGDQGPQGDPGFAPTVAIAKEGKTTTITITDADGQHVAEILDGEDGAGQVSSVNGQTGEVNLAAEDVGACTPEEVDAKIAAAAPQSWSITVPHAGWDASTATWPEAGFTAKWETTVEAEGMTADVEIRSGGISYDGGSLDAAGQWDWLSTGEGTVTLYSARNVAPAADFSLILTEVRQ